MILKDFGMITDLTTAKPLIVKGFEAHPREGGLGSPETRQSVLFRPVAPRRAAIGQPESAAEVEAFSAEDGERKNARSAYVWKRNGLREVACVCVDSKGVRGDSGACVESALVTGRIGLAMGSPGKGKGPPAMAVLFVFPLYFQNTKWSE